MEWLNLHLSTLRSPEYVGSSPAERGTWLSVLSYAASIECGGRLPNASTWKDRQWQQACGVTLREVRNAHRLLMADGDDIVVNGYPLAKEAQVRQARGVGMAGAMARWGRRHENGNGENNAEKMPTGIETPLPTANAEGKGRIREGEGKKRGNAASSPSAPANIPTELSGIPGLLAEWEEFRLHRRKQKAPMTLHAESLILTRLAERPHLAMRAIQYAITAGWRDIRWDWLQNRCPEMFVAGRHGSAQKSASVVDQVRAVIGEYHAWLKANYDAGLAEKMRDPAATNEEILREFLRERGGRV